MSLVTWLLEVSFVRIEDNRETCHLTSDVRKQILKLVSADRQAVIATTDATMGDVNEENDDVARDLVRGPSDEAKEALIDYGKYDSPGLRRNSS